MPTISTEVWLIAVMLSTVGSILFNILFPGVEDETKTFLKTHFSIRTLLIFVLGVVVIVLTASIISVFPLQHGDTSQKPTKQGSPPIIDTPSSTSTPPTRTPAATLSATPTTPPTSTPSTPWIDITYARSNTIEGKVGPLEYCNDQYRILVYAKVKISEDWGFQPSTSNQPLLIDSDCTWNTSTSSWDVLVVYLVPINTNFKLAFTHSPGIPAIEHSICSTKFERHPIGLAPLK